MQIVADNFTRNGNDGNNQAGICITDLKKTVQNSSTRFAMMDSCFFGKLQQVNSAMALDEGEE
jgi:hypothetical protein